MGKILIHSKGPEDWKQLLADPELHWKPGASAMSLALSWEKAVGEFPPEIKKLFRKSGFVEISELEPLLIIPELKVPLPGGTRASQTDVFVLAKGNAGLVPIAVEGKVDETFGPKVSEKRMKASPGQTERLDFLQEKLGLEDLPGNIRYQLVHRTVSAILLAEQYGAHAAVMLVHSFSQKKDGLNHFEDFQEFLKLFHVAAESDTLLQIDSIPNIRLFTGWCSGDPAFTSQDIR